MASSHPIPQLAPGQVRKRNVFDILELFGGSTTTSSHKAKNILIRVDFNVPMNSEGKITDDSRIRGALPTIAAVLQAKHNCILMSHMGRPKAVQTGKDTDGAERAALSLNHVVDRLSELSGIPVQFVPDCIAPQVKDAASKLPTTGGAILLLENLRFYPQEEANDPVFAQALASIADAYVQDAFGTCHRAHASVSGVPALLPASKCGVGCLVASEVAYLDFTSLGPNDKVAAVIGGSKVSTKLPVIQGLLNQVDTLILTGGLAFTFIRAQGISIGSSLVEDSMLETAKDILQQVQTKGKTIILPVDAVCSQTFPRGEMLKADTQTFDLIVGGGIPDGWMGLDAGPKTCALFRQGLADATKIVFNGPAGVFEIKPFDEGTKALVDMLEVKTKAGCVTVVGGGDSVAALEVFGKTQAVSYVSTGGGATLELLAGDVLPGVAAIADYE